MPGKLLKEPDHHTLADWDFENGDTYRFLSDVQFVSSPTSLLYWRPFGSFLTVILCRIPATLCLPQGELRTWIYPEGSFFTLFVFRNQAAFGSSNDENCYAIRIYGNLVQFNYWLNHLNYPISQTSCHYFLNQWTHYRLVWYNGKTPAEQEALCVDFYYEVAGEWVKEGDTMYDTANRWKDSEVNRCGYHPYITGGDHLYCDDTEIWGPV
ncbi:hypothetical protein ES703_75194 [subsurface metagenome]